MANNVPGPNLTLRIRVLQLKKRVQSVLYVNSNVNESVPVGFLSAFIKSKMIADTQKSITCATRECEINQVPIARLIFFAVRITLLVY